MIDKPFVCMSQNYLYPSNDLVFSGNEISRIIACIARCCYLDSIRPIQPSCYNNVPCHIAIFSIGEKGESMNISLIMLSMC